ncbi:MAG: 2-oxo-4-hydroxy-4-carboxy-5-ureidoimidazoline decarboxylase [Acinetobacter sp.]
MQLEEFNRYPSVEAEQLLKRCVNIPSWVIALAQQRPYKTRHALLDLAQKNTAVWTWLEVKTALDTHPRIGEKKAKQHLTAEEQAFSDREQAGIAQDQTTLDALYQGNVAYEQKFGFIFLIKAAGLSSEQILQALQQRLQHSLEDEKDIVKQQLAAIALLRLEQEISA